MNTITVEKQQVIKTLSSIKDDNVSIAGININRRNLLDALKLQDQPDSDRLTLTYGKVSWFNADGSNELDNEPCIQISCNHTVMRFLNRATVKYGDPKVTPLNFIDYRQYNPINNNLTGIPLNVKELIKALNYTMVNLADKNEYRDKFRCVLFESTDNNNLLLIAADGFRLGISQIDALRLPELKAMIHYDDLKRLLQYLKSIKPIGKGKSKYYPDVFMQTTDKALQFNTELTNIVLPINDYTFPSYPELIPLDGTPITFNANELLEAVKALTHIAKDSSGIIRLKFIKKHIELSATSPEYGTSKVNCNASVSRDCYTAINYKYLKDYLTQVKNQTVTVAINTPSSPIVFTTQDNNVSVIMPMFVQW